METLKLGWIDFSKEDRKKALDVIGLLSEPGAIDELGVGVIRDTYSDIFFPGTSTIQTRAKYFLLVPYLCLEVERSKTLSASRMLDELNEMELDMIDVLKAEGETGIIGELAGRGLKRKPSEIYWGGLKAFGIFKSKGLSLDEYLRVVSKRKHDMSWKKKTANSGEHGNVGDFDDPDAFAGDFVGFWKVPLPEKGWRDCVSIGLTRKEAFHLKAMIQTSQPESMMAQVLDKGIKGFYEADRFEQLVGLISMFSDEIQKHFWDAKRIAEFLMGIQIRFNMILAQGTNPSLYKTWDDWLADESSKAHLNLDIIREVGINNHSLLGFLSGCQEAIIKRDINELEKRIIERERTLKGAARAKTSNLQDLEYKSWVGLGRLQYRFQNAKPIMLEIHKGVEA